MGWPGGEVDFGYWATRLPALFGLAKNINVMGAKARRNWAAAQPDTVLSYAIRR
jgi:hypothetical protein